MLSKARLGEDKDIEFRYKLDEAIPFKLYGDYARVKQIILNLLTNAIKYTDKGYIDFTVSCVSNNNICRLIISVEDSGRGIKKESITKLFDKFERLDEENSTIEGTGLGLAITKKLVELMNGKIVVQSIFGKGSKFTVVLDQRIVEQEGKAEEIKDIELKPVDLKGKKVLIVDDNNLNLKVAERLLKPYNLECVSLNSGNKCIEEINSGKKYDLILMDDMMPKLSGTKTLEILKSDSKFNTPVIALTANAISGMREKYLESGFSDYLPKPIEKSELHEILIKYLG
jgi:CheY-like chemotaxis protein